MFPSMYIMYFDQIDPICYSFLSPLLNNLKGFIDHLFFRGVMTGVRIQGFVSHISSPFCSGYFGDGSSFSSAWVLNTGPHAC
jgi:hypothetical protein